MEHENAYASKGVAGTGLGLGIAGTALGLLNSNGGGLGGLFGNGGCNKDCGGNRDTGAGLLTATAALMNSCMNSNRSCGYSEEHTVTRYEASQAARIAELETEVKLRDANTYTDAKILDLYRYVDGRFAGVESQICSQAVVNAQITANISCMQNAINTLNGLTKTVIPIDSVCPEPMKAYNSWTAPTTPTTGA